MARKLRSMISETMYHVTSRGNRKGTLFFDSHDYFKYLSLHKEAKTLDLFKILSYCMKTDQINRILLQFQPQEHQISQIISVLLPRFANYFHPIILKIYRHDSNIHNSDSEVSNNDGIVNIQL